MTALLKWALLVPVGILAVMLAIANRAPVELSFDPFGASDLRVAAPLFIVMFVSIMVGVVIGGTGVWMRQGRHRRAAREARSNAGRLQAEADRLRTRTSSLTALSPPGDGDARRAA